MSPEAFRALVLSFPGTEENPHFDRRAFKVTGRRIFATILEKSRSVNVKLHPSEQEEFCTLGGEAIYPVPNKWGQQGWTTIDLTLVSDELLIAAVETAYHDVLSGGRKKKK